MYKTANYNANLNEEDALGLRFSANGNNEVDVLDATKLGNTGINLAVVNGNRILSIENRALPQDGEILPLFFNNLATENYTFRFQKGNVPDNLKVILNDAYLETSTEITENFQTYSFDVDMAIDASKASQRFSLVFEEIILSVNENEMIDVMLFPNPATDFVEFNYDFSSENITAVEVSNILGQKFEVTMSENTSVGNVHLDVKNLAVGLYILSVRMNNGKTLEGKFIKQ
jgi:hypothetical protein